MGDASASIPSALIDTSNYPSYPVYSISETAHLVPTVLLRTKQTPHLQIASSTEKRLPQPYYFVVTVSRYHLCFPGCFLFSQYSYQNHSHHQTSNPCTSNETISWRFFHQPQAYLLSFYVLVKSVCSASDSVWVSLGRLVLSSGKYSRTKDSGFSCNQII